MARERSLLTVALCLVSLVWLLAQQQTPPAFRAGANLVLVDAYPQHDGQIVEGLTPDDFDVLEDGKPQKVEAFEFVRVEPNVPQTERRDPNNTREMYALAADPHNRVFVVYLDTLHTTVEGSHAIRAPLVNALERIVGPTDLFGVMTPNMRPTDLTLGRLTLSIDEQLSKYWTWGQRQRITTDQTDPMEASLTECFHQKETPQVVDWLVPDGAARRFFDELLIERRREERTLQSLQDLIRYLTKIRDARTSVLAITDGWVLSSENQSLAQEPLRPPADVRASQATRMPGGMLPGAAGGTGVGDFAACMSELNRNVYLDGARHFRDIVTDANHSNVSFYPVATTGLAVFDSSIGEQTFANPNSRSGGTLLSRDSHRVNDRMQSLRTIAENTDGIAIVGTNDLAGGIKRIVDDVSAYYLLGYTSTNPKDDGTFRRIQVKMKKPGLTVHARRGYMSMSESSRAAANAAAAAVPAGSPAIEAALGSLARLQSSADVLTYGAASGSDLAIVAEIAGARMDSGKWAKGGDVEVVVTGPKGEATGTVTGRIDPAARGTLLHVPLTAGASGPWRVNVKVTSGGERLEERATIDATPAGALLGPALMYRAAPGPRSPIRPVADFQFRRTERVHIELPVLKALDQRQARLLGKSGQPLAVGATVTESARGRREDSASAPAAGAGVGPRANEGSSAGATASGSGVPLAPDKDGVLMLSVDVNLAPLAPGDYVIEVTAGSGGATERRLLAIRVQ